MAIQTGQTVSHYRILEHLGGGGMGVVYTAEDTRLKRTVALKFLPPELTCDPEAKLRFIHEAQAASSLQHNNICVVHDIDETSDGQIFICMEYLDGETLKKKIERGPLNIADAINIAMQVGSGLSKAHGHGIIHRDIKPANILVTSGGVVKIVDFGLAKLACQTTVTRSGSTVGTAAYMSPEQAMGDDVDQRADIWSLGVVLYQMLAGNLPFRGEFDQGQIYSILNERPRPLTEARAGIPSGLNAVVDKSLEKKRSDRYGSAQEMIDDLAAFGKAVTPDRVPRSRLHHRTRVTVVLAGATVLMALSIAAYFLLPRGNEDATHGTLASTHMENASIAVLPFTDLSPGKDQDYFCSGIAEELTSVLTQIPDLKVVSRARAFGLSKDVTDLKDMGRQLGVVTMLDGSVRKDGDHLRITAQLINTSDGAQIWTDTYDRTLKDIFAIQKEVARSVVAALQVTLAPLAWGGTMPHQSSNIDAYESWLRGSYFVKLYLVSNKEQDIQNAIRLFETATALDTTYALAYAGVAWAYEHKFLMGGHTIHSDREQVVRSILKAYQLDSLSGAVNAGMGYLACVNRDYDMAYHFHRTALTLEPRSYLVNYLAGEYYASMGLNEQSEVLFDKSIVGDPYYLLALGEAADALEQRGEFQKATSYYERALRLSPNDPLYRASYVEHLIKTSRVKEASSLLDEAMRRNPDFPMFTRCRAMVLAAHGERKQALTLAPLPEVYALLGMWNDALRALEEKAGTSSAYNYQSVATNPLFNPVHNDLRYQAILSRLEATYKERVEKYGGLGGS